MARSSSRTPDPRGPIVSPGLKPRVVADGVEASGYRFQPVEHAPPCAGWLWLDAPAPLALFRAEWTLDAAPGRAAVCVSADRSYRLWVNGTLASRGPDDIGMDYHRVQNDRWLYDVREIGHLLRPGANALAVEAFEGGLIGWEATRGRGGLLCEVQVAGEALPLAWTVRRGEHWRQTEGHWRSEPAREPDGWRLPGFDASGWAAATSVPDRWLPREASMIPPRMETVFPPVAATRFPLSIPSGGAAMVRYDRVLPAYVSVVVDGGAGGVLYIEPNEMPVPGFNRRASVALDGDRRVVELPFLDSFSAVNLRLVGGSGPAVVREVRASFASLPVAYQGSFACSDPALTRLWSVCRWATQICLQTHHLDSPHHQEPISDPGDYLIASLINYGAFFAPHLTRQDCRKYAGILRACRNQVFHTSYALLWLQMLLDYGDYTGDEALLRELAPEVFSLLETFIGYRGRNGLISEAPNYMFLDWVDIAGFPGHHPPAVIGQGYLTAFTYRALADGVRVARRVGDTGRAARYEALRADIAAAFERELWVAQKGLYRDGKPFQTSVKPGQWLPADTNVETFTSHVNVLAVLYGLAPPERRAAVLERALDSPAFTCQPYFMHFVFDALAQAGLYEKRAPAQLRRWKIVEETQSLREMWTVGDLSHSWGATPLHQCQARILGVRPLAPGFSELEIAPLPSGLAWAKGQVPTPNGPVRVAWRVDGDRFRLDVTVPPGARAQVRLPGDEVPRRVGPGRRRFVKNA